MIRIFWVLGFAWFYGLLPTLAGEADANEEILFNAAGRSFKNGFYERADKEFADFINLYPNSKRLPEVILLRAQSLFELKQYEAIIKLLSSRLAQAGKDADKYQYWMAEAHFYNRNYRAAAAAYRQLIDKTPESFFLSNAVFGEAMAWFKLGNIATTLAKLRAPDSQFQKLAQAQPNDPYILRGYLLLGEALMQQKDFAQVEATLNSLTNRNLSPQLDWQRRLLMVREELEHRHLETAVQNIPGLLLAATNTGSTLNLAETILLQGQVLETAKEFKKAAAVYEQSWPSLPEPIKRQALSKLVALNLSETNISASIQFLELLAAQYQKEPDLDQVRLALGELLLKDYHARKPPEAETNVPPALITRAVILRQALANFDLLVTAYPKSPLLAQAHLNRGWCYWEAGNMSNSLSAFKEAAERFPPGTNQALARFKLADAQFQMTNYVGARQNYRLLLEQAATLPLIPKDLLEQTLYQLIQVSVRIDPPDLAEATNALNKITSLFPTGAYGDRCHLLVGQLLTRLNETAKARDLLAAALPRFHRSDLRPELELAISRTYVQETNWLAAAGKFEAWVTSHTNHPGLAKVEFDLAWAYDQAGQESNAFRLFTNYVLRFSESPLAPTARYWIGNYYFNLGGYDPTNYVEAEKNYQLVYEKSTNWPVTELTYQARLAAGRAAYAGQRYSNATNHFTQLINLLNSDTNSPAYLLPEAWYALGDTWPECYVTNAAQSLQKFSQAIIAFQKVPDTNRLAPRAWTRIADCHYQLASQNPSRYTNAISYYLMVITNQSPFADIEVRSEAEVGLGALFKSQASSTNKTISEISALYDLALERFLNVVYEKNINLRINFNEKPSVFWVAKAGQEAADILETKGNWPLLVELYGYLKAKLPTSVAGALDKKLDRAKKHLSP